MSRFEPLNNLSEESRSLFDGTAYFLKEQLLECSASATTVFLVLKVNDITEVGPRTGVDAGAAQDSI